MRFLGQVQPELDWDMTRTLEVVCARHEPFSAEVAGGGLFGTTTVYLGLVDDGRIVPLARDFDATCC